jgi:hypothetical protein
MQEHFYAAGRALSNKAVQALQRPVVTTEGQLQTGRRALQWSGASKVGPTDRRDTQRWRLRKAQIDAKSRALAIHYNRRRRGILKTHGFGRYEIGLRERRYYLTFPAELLELRAGLAKICAVILLACCRFRACALRAERRELASWLGVHRDTITRWMRQLEKMGLVLREQRFIDQPCIGKRGRVLFNPQIANWYAPGPALRAIWLRHKSTTFTRSCPQGADLLAELLGSVDSNNSLDPEAWPHRDNKDIGSNAPPSGDKVSATPTVVQKPATPAQNSANKRAAAVGPSTAVDSPAVPKRPPADASVAEHLFYLYYADPERADTFARALLISDQHAKRQKCEASSRSAEGGAAHASGRSSAQAASSAQPASARRLTRRGKALRQR